MTAIAAHRSDARLLGRWIAARVRMTLRSPRALGFTFAFPLVLRHLVRRASTPACRSRVGRHGRPFTQYYTPAIGVFSLTTACYTSLVVGLATARETGCSSACAAPRCPSRSTSARGAPARC